ncbi:hypothetical protein [Streptomyces sp. NPDC055140]
MPVSESMAVSGGWSFGQAELFEGRGGPPPETIDSGERISGERRTTYEIARDSREHQQDQPPPGSTKQ